MIIEFLSKFPFWYGSINEYKKVGQGLGWQQLGSIPTILNYIPTQSQQDMYCKTAGTFIYTIDCDRYRKDTRMHLWCNESLVSCIYDAMHLWCAESLVRCIIVVLQLWCDVNFVIYIFIATFLWCTASSVHCIFGAMYLHFWYVMHWHLWCV